MIIYGSMMCPDCVACREALDQVGVQYEFLDFAQNLKNLKEFLVLRDQNEIFEPVKAAGKIGIPCIVLPNGIVKFDWQDMV